MYCPNCRKEVGKVDFCPTCGTELLPVGAENAPAPAASAGAQTHNEPNHGMNNAGAQNFSVPNYAINNAGVQKYSVPNYGVNNAGAQNASPLAKPDRSDKIVFKILYLVFFVLFFISLCLPLFYRTCRGESSYGTYYGGTNYYWYNSDYNLFEAVSRNDEAVSVISFILLMLMCLATLVYAVIRMISKTSTVYPSAIPQKRSLIPPTVDRIITTILLTFQFNTLSVFCIAWSAHYEYIYASSYYDYYLDNGYYSSFCTDSIIFIPFLLLALMFLFQDIPVFIGSGKSGRKIAGIVLRSIGALGMVVSFILTISLDYGYIGFPIAYLFLFVGRLVFGLIPVKEKPAIAAMPYPVMPNAYAYNPMTPTVPLQTAPQQFAPQQFVPQQPVPPQFAPTQPVPQRSADANAAEALTQYKNLLDQGILTQEEFDAKKKQLLGL